MVTLCNTSFTWTITNFAGLDRQPVQSSRIKGCESSGPEFSATLYPWGFPWSQESRGEEHVAICLQIHDSQEGKSYNMRYSFAILDVTSCKTCLIQDEKAITPKARSLYYNLTKRCDLLSNSEILLPNRQLTIFVEVSIMNDLGVYLGATEERMQCTEPQRQEMMEELPRDLWKLYQSGNYADRCFVVGGVKKMAHSAILGARSSKLSKLFADGSNEVYIDDIKPDVFEGVLQFIYTEKMNQNLDERAADLLMAATKFGMSKLQQRAEDALIRKMDVSNVARLLILSFEHDAPHLKNRAMEFLIEHKKAVKGTAGWRDLSKYPEIMFELFASL